MKTVTETKETKTMKTLPTEMTRDGFHFRQLRREGDLALYVKSKKGVGGPIESFEVVRVQRAKSDHTYPKNGQQVKAGDESYPKNSQWGDYGWTYPDEETAKRAFSEKLKEVNELAGNTN